MCTRATSAAGCRVGDVVVVLVGRVGEAAVVTAEFHDWNAVRTVAIIRIAESDQAGLAQVVAQGVARFARGA